MLSYSFVTKASMPTNEIRFGIVIFFPSLHHWFECNIQCSMHATVRFPIRIFHFDIWTFSICMKSTRDILVCKISNSLAPQNNSNPFFPLYAFDRRCIDKLQHEQNERFQEEKNSLKWITFFRFLQSLFADFFNCQRRENFKMSVSGTFENENAFQRMQLG